MPVFKAGESHARAAASLLRVPFFSVSHQEGHIRAARVDSGLDGGEFLALHLSGGTTELLCVRDGALSLLGGSTDLHAGQLVDRVGSRMAYDYGGFCGAGSGLIPVTSFQPRMRIKEMAVGGTAE